MFSLRLLCYVFYTICVTCFHKPSVNAEPLSPPIFEEIAAHKKKGVSSHVCVCVCVFSIFKILLIFGYPLPTACARLVSF